jgi:hypothetical protein
MAGFAPGQNMRARQIKARLHVVKFYGTGGLRKINVGQDHQGQYKHEHKPDPPRQTGPMKWIFDCDFYILTAHFAAPEKNLKLLPPGIMVPICYSILPASVRQDFYSLVSCQFNKKSQRPSESPRLVPVCCNEGQTCGDEWLKNRDGRSTMFYP